MSARSIREARPPLSRGPSSFQQSLAALSLANMATTSSESAGRLDEATVHAVGTALSSPEPENQRGRKRRRSPMPFAIVSTAHNPSGESSTFRGRRRYRSTSLVNLSSRNTSGSFRDLSYSPSRRRLLRVVQIDRRRSQSPSRSRSAFGKQEPSKRRRHRTRSRSRSHKDSSLAILDIRSRLQYEVIAPDRETAEPDKG